MGYDGSLQISNIAGEINWGDALDLIKHEGFYLFGGLNGKRIPTNELLVFGIE